MRYVGSFDYPRWHVLPLYYEWRGAISRDYAWKAPRDRYGVAQSFFNARTLTPS